MLSFANVLIVAVFSAANCGGEVQKSENLFKDNRWKRVKNGSPAEPNSSPWMGQLYRGEDFLCNVFLVSRPPNTYSNVEHGSSDIVITVADDLFGFSWINLTDDMRVSFGRQSLDGTGENQMDVSVEKAIAHNEFWHTRNREQFALHDIAMLKLVQPVNFTDFVRPIALANSSSLTNCSFTGWEKIPMISGDDQKVKSTVVITHVVSKNNVLIVKPNNKTRFTEGDGGAPMICHSNGQPYARGMSSIGLGIRELLTDLFFHANWISNAFKNIDEKEPSHPDLAKYPKQKLNGKFIVEKHLQYALRGAIGSTPKEFNKMLVLQEIGKSYSTQLWHKTFIPNFLLVWNDQFCIHEIKGYVDVEDIYICATQCAIKNTLGVCNYLPSLKRCYFAGARLGSRYCAKMPAQTSVAISFHDDDRWVDYRTPLRLPLTMERHKPLGNSWKSAVWNVSIQTSTWSNFHCLGYLTSKRKELAYTNITYSMECFKRIMTDVANSTIKILAILGSRIINVKLINKYECIVDVKGYCTRPIGRISKPSGYPKTFGHSTTEIHKPVLKKFSPFSGAFMSDPYSMPWMAYFLTNQNETCIGIVISTFNLTGEGAENESSALLTTATCAKDINSSTTVHTQSHFLNSMSPYEKLYNVRRVIIHPNFTANATEDGSKLDLDEFNIAIIVLEESIKFNILISPIQLPSNLSKSDKRGSILLGAAWNVYGSDEYGSLYEIPMEHKTEARPSRGTFITTRTYLKGNLTFDTEAKSKPIIFHNKQGKSFLVGLHVKTEIHNKRFVERNLYIKQHIPWIQEKLKRTRPSLTVLTPIKVGRNMMIDPDDY